MSRELREIGELRELRPPSPDEPAVTAPGLRRLVDLAREQTIPALRVDAEAVFRGYTAARQGQRRTLAAAGLLAAGLAGLALSRPVLEGAPVAGPSGQVAQHMAPGPDAPRRAVPRPASLAGEVRIVAEGETPGPTVLGPWSVGLAPGSYAVEVDDHAGDEVLRARSAGGTVELHHGSVQILVGADRTEARLIAGEATWVAPLGERTRLGPHEPGPSDISSRVEAVELARRAEARLTAGRRAEAIEILTRIVTDHPQHDAARSALLDLGGLLRGEGRADEARCAYRLWLTRYTAKAQLADDVRRALDRLGEGPACRGLRPR